MRFETFFIKQLSLASFVPDSKIQKSPLSGPLQNACFVKLIYSNSSVHTVILLKNQQKHFPTMSDG